MENKEYYTPSEEELFIGYSCQRRVKTHLIQGLNGKSSGYLDRELNNWKDFIITPKYWQGGFSESTGFADYELELRTPFLFKEDIEKEGWKILKDSEDYFDLYKGSPVIFQYRQYILRYSTHFLISIENEYFTKYAGGCKSINEFRKLIKWLNIK